jgi:trehalose synthase
MSELLEVDTAALPLSRFQNIITADQYRRLMAVVSEAERVFAGRTIWNVNSTASGGGVAEMLRSLIGYIKGINLDARWLVIPGNAEFFRVTKRIHNHLHGAAGDGGRLDDAARETYEGTLKPTAQALAARVRPGDIVVLHDPQTAGLIPAIRKVTPFVVWRCHVGLDLPNDLARAAWRFLLPYVTEAQVYVFSRADFAWEGLERSKIWVIPPSIDAFSPKNRDLSLEQVQSILTVAGIVSGASTSLAQFERSDGTLAQVLHRAEMVEESRASLTDRLVVQVSRWDQLKDPVGVIRGFAEHVAPYCNAHLIVAGPAVEAVADDPEGRQVLEDSVRAREALAPSVRPSVHLAVLPMVDSEENAVLVNALQRQATVVVQKSLAEGFGLTVAEAMWKGRPVVASRIGGIQDQIDDGRTGLLLNDPRDLAEYGRAVRRLLEDPALASKIGEAAREKVRNHFLGPRHLMQYAELFQQFLATPRASQQPD